MMAILSRRASDLAMVDLVKVGGVTGWLDAASICEAAGVPVSNHFYQEMSAHLLALSPVAHYFEYIGVADAVKQFRYGHFLFEPSVRCVVACAVPSVQ